MRYFRLMFALPVVLAVAACGGGSAGQPPAATPDALTRGIAAQNANKTDEATKDYFEVLFNDPKNKFAFYNLGEIAQRQNRMAAAESFYRLALEQDSKMTSALFNLAIVRTNLGATADAVSLYRQVIAVDPNYAAAHFNLGLLLRQLGQTADAQTELATAQRLDAKLVAPSPSATPVQQASPTRKP